MTMSDALHLENSSSNESELESETRKRVWWSLYMADRWCVSNLGMTSYKTGPTPRIERPMEESIFNSMVSTQRSLEAPPKAGLWAQMTVLVELFDPIQTLHRSIVNGTIPEADLHQDLLDVAERLDSWISMLPEDAQMNNENLLHRQAMGVGGLLIAIHLAYHHFSTLLYFRFLENHQAPSLDDITYIKRCKWHASNFSGLIQKSRQLRGCEAVYPLVGHMTTVSSSVLIHTLLFGAENELEAARKNLNANFESLLELKQYWPATVAWVRQTQALTSYKSNSADRPLLD